jgi:threonyl-tRNA synthetase
MVIIGANEDDAKTISVRDRSGKETKDLKIDAFTKTLVEEIGSRRN